ncbi:MAG: glycosyltransferase [archaeon]
MVDTSIVASMYNKNPHTLEIIEKIFIPSILNNASKKIELILIDDKSPLSKETDELINKFSKDLELKLGNFRYVKNKKNLGFAGSYNEGFKLAKGKFILMTNDDVYFSKDSIKNLCKTLNSEKNIGAVGPVTNYAASFQNTSLFARLKSYSQEELERIEKFAANLHDTMQGKKYTPETLIGFCVIYRRSLLKSARYLDVRYKYGNFEEQDLHERIKKKGYKLILDASVFVEHGGINGGSGSILQHRFKAIKHFLMNAFRFAMAQKIFFKLIRVYFIKSYLQMKDYGFTITKDIIKNSEKNKK